MKIAVIGAGKVGKTLAKGWAEAGHQVIFGLKNVEQAKIRKDLSEIKDVPLHSIKDAVAQADFWYWQCPQQHYPHCPGN